MGSTCIVCITVTSTFISGITSFHTVLSSSLYLTRTCLFLVNADKPEPSPLLTAETIFSELHPIADKWEELGEALGVPEHILDNISTEGSDQVRLHEMVHYYFSSTQFTHTWEEIVRALREIGETEAADRIVRTGKARGVYVLQCFGSLIIRLLLCVYSGSAFSFGNTNYKFRYML